MTAWRPILVTAIIMVSPLALADRGDVTLLAGPVTGGSFDGAGTGPDLDIDSAPSIGVALHIDAAAGGQYEILYLRQSTDIGIGEPFVTGDEVDLTVEYLQFGGNYSFGAYDEDRWQTYAMLTIGAARYSPDAPDTESETFAAMTGGVGVLRQLGDRFSFRLEARALATWINDRTDIFCVSDGGAVCAISAEGDTLWQWTALAAVSYRF